MDRPGHVHSATQSSFAPVGALQRDRHPVLPARAWLQALLLDIWRQVSHNLQY